MKRPSAAAWERALASGLSRREIAKRLGVSPDAVRYHQRRAAGRRANNSGSPPPAVQAPSPAVQAAAPEAPAPPDDPESQAPAESSAEDPAARFREGAGLGAPAAPEAGPPRGAPGDDLTIDSDQLRAVVVSCSGIALFLFLRGFCLVSGRRLAAGDLWDQAQFSPKEEAALANKAGPLAGRLAELLGDKAGKAAEWGPFALALGLIAFAKVGALPPAPRTRKAPDAGS